MNDVDLNSFIYRIHYEVESMKRWGFSVNDSLNDHAVRLDAVKVKAVGEMEKIREEIEGVRAAVVLNQSDTLKVMGTLESNDANIKTILNGITMEIAGKISVIESSNEDMQLRFDELRRHIQAGPPEPAPGLGDAGAKGLTSRAK